MVFQKSFKTPTSGGNTMARVTASVALWWSYGTAISGCPVCTERIGCYWPSQHLPVATVPLQVAASRPSSGLPAHEIIPSSAWQSHSPRLIWRVSSPGCPLFDCFNPSQENCNFFRFGSPSQTNMVENCGKWFKHIKHVVFQPPTSPHIWKHLVPVAPVECQVPLASAPPGHLSFRAVELQHPQFPCRSVESRQEFFPSSLVTKVSKGRGTKNKEAGWKNQMK